MNMTDTFTKPRNLDPKPPTSTDRHSFLPFQDTRKVGIIFIFYLCKKSVSSIERAEGVKESKKYVDMRCLEIEFETKIKKYFLICFEQIKTKWLNFLAEIMD